MYNAGLVCEGGGTKIAYTGGVLKCLLEQDIMLPYSVGVSAAAEVLEAYVAKQPRRLEVTCVDSVSDGNVVGLMPLIKEGSLFALEKTSAYIEKHAPLDFETFFSNPARLDIGVYVLESKEILYYPKEYVTPDNALVIASCSLLLLAKVRDFDGKRVIDAGLRDMIPVGQALKSGCDRVLVISTKEKDYKRKAAPWWQLALAKLIYRDPAVIQDLKRRHLSYQEQWDVVAGLEQEGKALVLRPHKDMGITRYTTDAAALQAWFDLGYAETMERIDEIRTFLGLGNE